MNIIIRIKALYTTKLPDLATSVVGLLTPWDFGIKSADWSKLWHQKQFVKLQTSQSLGSSFSE